MSTTSIIPLLLVVLIAVGVCNAYRKKVEHLQSDLKYYSETYKTRNGSVQMHDKFVNYNWVSVDGGHTWYNREDMTKADPDVMKTVNSWDALMDAVDRKGPLNLANPEDQKILTDAGFEIVKKK